MGNLSNLPADIVLDILTRLPTETVLDCKLVSKPWRNLISHHPSFRQMHLSRLNQSAPDSGMLSYLVYQENKPLLHYIEYNEDNVDTAPIGSIRRISFTPPFTPYCVLGSFNGLVCIYGWEEVAYCICNPVTREYVMLPKISIAIPVNVMLPRFIRNCDYRYIYWSSGFGYNSLTNEYKVVEVYKIRGEMDFMEVEVYTLGSGHGWRHVGRLDTRVACADNALSGGVVCVNGALHFRDGRRGKVSVFDLTEEKFSEFLSTPPLPQNGSYNYLGELGSVLCYVVKYYIPRDFDIWLLKEKNKNLDRKEQVEHEPLAWRKEFSLLEGVPLAFTKSGGVLCFDTKSVGIYDPIASTSKKLVEFAAYVNILPYKNTLISLKELGEEDIKIMESVSYIDEDRELKAVILTT